MLARLISKVFAFAVFFCVFGSPWSCYFASKFYFLVWIIQSDAGTWPKFSVCNFQYRLSGVLQNILATGQTCSIRWWTYLLIEPFLLPAEDPILEIKVVFDYIEWFVGCGSRARSSLFILLRTFVKLGCCWVEVHSYHCKRLNRPEASSATAIKYQGDFFRVEIAVAIFLRFEKRLRFLLQARKFFSTCGRDRNLDKY